MKKSRFTEDQMVRILREADQTSVAAAAKAHAVSEQTIYTWRKRYGELEVNDVRHLRAIEKENTRLKKLLAERDLEIEIMKEVNAKKEEVLISVEAVVMWATHFMLPLNLLKMFCLHIQLAENTLKVGWARWTAWALRKSKEVDFTQVKTLWLEA